MIPRNRKVVVALGGNALVRSGETATLAVQARNVGRAMRSLLPLLRNGNKLVITHGNGFQVGNILIRVEESLGKAYGIPLEVCVAESQGEIGYLIEQSLQNVLVDAGVQIPVVSLLTQVVVDAADPAFREPTKPIGPVLTKPQARRLERNGMPTVKERGRGWRRVVASPRPLEIDDVDVVRWLLRKPVIVVAAGGGGVPVVRGRGRKLRGVAAVIDKDAASAVLARDVGARHLIILTGERAVFRDYGEHRQRALRELSTAEAQALHDAGHFPPGSMGPKIRAAIDFVEGGGSTVVITDVPHLARALAGKAGTTIRAAQPSKTRS